jgi:hypothetical protein
MLEDALNNLSLRTYLVIALLNVLMVMGGLALIYYGDQFATPSWHTRSVPAPSLFQ